MVKRTFSMFGFWPDLERHVRDVLIVEQIDCTDTGRPLRILYRPIHRYRPGAMFWMTKGPALPGVLLAKLASG